MKDKLYVVRTEHSRCTFTKREEARAYRKLYGGTLQEYVLVKRKRKDPSTQYAKLPVFLLEYAKLLKGAYDDDMFTERMAAVSPLVRKYVDSL